MSDTQQTVIISGASGGLGAAIAVELAKLGANVVLNARRETLLKETAAKVAEAGGKAAVAAGSVTDPQVCAAVVQTAEETFGSVDAIIHNAAVIEPFTTIENADLDQWRSTFEVNLFGALQLTQAALSHLRTAKGRVIAISSGAALRGYPTWGAYGATKAALNHFVLTLSAEEHDITAISMRPGVVNTPMQAKIRSEGADVMPDFLVEKFVDQYESGEILDPEQPGHAAAMLALYAPPDWSGQSLKWDDEYVRRLISRHEIGTVGES